MLRLPVRDVGIKVHVFDVFHLVIFDQDVEVHEQIEPYHFPLPHQYNGCQQYHNCSHSNESDCPDWKVIVTSHLVAV